jgi:hypothetical protein
MTRYFGTRIRGIHIGLANLIAIARPLAANETQGCQCLTRYWERSRTPRSLRLDVTPNERCKSADARQFNCGTRRWEAPPSFGRACAQLCAV